VITWTAVGWLRKCAMNKVLAAWHVAVTRVEACVGVGMELGEFRYFPAPWE
jgi:hypothetical protein